MDMQPLSPSELAALPARDRILFTAHRLFYQEGIRATGVDRVIKEAGVTKVTFYRHFPGKDALILAFLHLRHQCWMQWFATTLARNNTREVGLAAALANTLQEWFVDENFRGCAFINSSLEYAHALPEVLTLSVEHKQAMAQEVARYLPADRQQMPHARSIALLIDGAIVQAQIAGDARQVSGLLQEVLEVLLAGWQDSEANPRP
ncbi:MAG: helix-turn-helix domain containing protein [Rouxiella aceris]|uniref:TetR/AcrR family transcriptional regulator n=1 Tax=Rouxiella aceris TaxID=2703884 RepID=UPI00284C4C4B|nr:helix-turn-helix domain-containing protein [Rouxiella aceris]MDR3431585.1 helix-turn-helix domain containing protein [Rouxiella aceris]